MLFVYSGEKSAWVWRSKVRFSGDSAPSLSVPLSKAHWSLLNTWRRRLAITAERALQFLTVPPYQTLLCAKELWSVMIMAACRRRPGSQALDAIDGFSFKQAVFDVFGG